MSTINNNTSQLANRVVLGVASVAMLLRYYFAAIIPLGNDEVYYWDWGRDLRLSYFDHPPGVSWLAAGAQEIFGKSTLGLQARGLIPALHFVTSLILFKIYIDLAGKRRRRTGDIAFLCMTQLIPAFGIGGFVLLPDAGLLLFASAGLLLTTRLAKMNSPGLRAGLAAGLIAGFAGLFKYHAAPIFAGLFLGLAAARNWDFRRTKIFWGTTLVTGLVTTLPVWIWNAQNNMASFTFQANRGIAGANFNLLRASRTLAGEFLFLTPGFFILLAMTVFNLWRHRKHSTEKIILGSTLPLLLLIHVTMMYKEVLPHWGLPAFWLLIPAAAIFAGQQWSATKLHRNVVMAGVITTLIIAVAGIPAIRSGLIDRAKGYPGALGELTFWPEFSRSPQFADLQDKIGSSLTQAKTVNCPAQPILASFRWFSVAHMAWSLPGQPVVRFFEDGAKYYYHDRDRKLDASNYSPETVSFSGCPVLAIGERAHANLSEIQDRMNVALTGEIVIGQYLDRPLSWWAGYLK